MNPSRLPRPLHRITGVACVLLAIAVVPSPARSSDRIVDRAPPDGTVLRIETGVHAAAVRRISVSPDGRRMVSASDDKTARVWDLADGSLRGVMRPRVGPGEIGRLYGVAVHPSQDLVAIGGSTGSARGREHRILLHRLSDSAPIRAFDARGGDVKRLAWSSDGSLLFAVYAGDHAVRAFDVQGTLRHETRLRGPAYGLAVSKQGLVAVASFDGGLLLLQASAGRVSEHARLATADRQPAGVAFSPDGARLIVGFNTPGVAPELFDVAAGRAIARLPSPPLEEGNRMTVAWSADGRRIAVGGTGRHQRLGFPVFLHDASSLQLVGQFDVATDSILDLAPIDGARFAYGAFDGSWGVLEAAAIGRQVRPSIPDLREPSALRVSADGQRVAWNLSYDRDPVSFDFATRTFRRGQPDASLKAARTSSGLFSRDHWQNVPDPVVAGRSIALEPGEISRAVSNFENGDGAILATSRQLIRVGADGAVRWRVRLGVEARAAVVTAGDRAIVTGMADGSLRWWRAADGETLLSLLATRDGRWIAWTPAGYFDASTGADRLIGWAVNRDDVATADFHPVTRFRERFNRPAEIDGLLRDLAPQARAASTEPAPARPPPATTSAPRPGAVAETPVAAPQVFPPVIELAGAGAVRRDGGTWQIAFALRNAGPQTDVELRVDGRPVPPTSIQLGAANDGTRRGSVAIPAPRDGSLVQLLAKNSQGVAEPLTVAAPPAAATAAPATSAPARVATPPPLSAPLAAPLAARIPTPPGVAEPAATPALPRLFVLAIGISKYQRKEYELGLAAKDAGDFARAMAAQQGRLYRDVEVRRLLDGDASATGIAAGLEWLRASVGPDDLAMLFMAGHGVNTDDGRYFFLPWDADHRQLERTAVSEEQLRATLGRLRGKTLMFVDTCHGSAVISRLGSSELARMANNLSSAENGVIVFASSSGRQLSLENDDWGNGAFTRALLDGLTGKADLTRSGRVTFKGLDFYVSEEVRRLTEGRQTPVTIAPLGIPDFTVARL